MKRYRIVVDMSMCDPNHCGAECDLVEDADGPWVRYDDVQTRIAVSDDLAKAKRYISDLERERGELREELISALLEKPMDNRRIAQLEREVHVAKSGERQHREQLGHLQARIVELERELAYYRETTFFGLEARHRKLREAAEEAAASGKDGDGIPVCLECQQYEEVCRCPMNALRRALAEDKEQP